jgi:integrase
LSDAVFARVAAELPSLKERDPGAWAAVTLMFFAGIRNIEAVAARWSWLGAVETDDNGAQVRGFRLESAGEHLSKQSDGLVPVRVDVWADLASVRHLGQTGEDFIVPGTTVTRRIEAAYYGASQFLQSCGVEKRRGKTTYRLRGKAISLMGQLYGNKTAARFARHTDEKTTEQNYTGNRGGFRAMPAMAGAAVAEK